MSEDEQNTQGNRKRFSAEEKFKIVKEHLTTRTAISEICKKYGVAVGSFYDWQEKFFEAALGGLDKKRGPQPSSARHEAEVDQLQSEITRMQAVIAEITAENIAYKKRTWDWTNVGSPANPSRRGG